MEPRRSTLTAEESTMVKRRKKRWSEMSRQQQVSTVAASIVELSLLAATLWDIWRRPAAQIKGSKAMWTGLAFINFVGPLAYFLFGRKRAA
jgi:hypothetical protein